MTINDGILKISEKLSEDVRSIKEEFEKFKDDFNKKNEELILTLKQKIEAMENEKQLFEQKTNAKEEEFTKKIEEKETLIKNNELKIEELQKESHKMELVKSLVEKHQQTMEKTNVAVICSFILPEDEKALFEKENTVKVSFTIDVINNINAKNIILDRNWSDVDVFMVYCGGKFPTWLGDFLFLKQQYQGKGIIVCYPQTASGERGICGAMEKEMPFELGVARYNDGPKSVTIVENEFSNDIKSFNGGKSSSRGDIKLKESNECKTTLMGTWIDEKKTPFVITKEYNDEGKGNIVVLNFWPRPNKKNTDWWDSNTDGDKIMQNAVMWASRKHKMIENKTKLSEFFENVKNVISNTIEDVN